MRYKILLLSVFCILLTAWIGWSQGRLDALRARLDTLHASLEGFNEVPAVSTPATGDFQANIDSNDTQLTYLLQFSNLSANSTQSHIHFGARSTIGGISIWLCGTATNPGPTGTPECPATSGTVMRTVTAADVVGPAGQGIAPGEFAEILNAIRSGKAYANVHSMMFTGGEIRGQIRARVR